MLHLNIQLTFLYATVLRSSTSFFQRSHGGAGAERIMNEPNLVPLNFGR
jgi:hypothetical protein